MAAEQFKIGFNNLNRWFKNLKSGVLFASVVIVLCFILTIIIFKKSIAETESLDQTTDVQYALEKTASGLKDIENGVHAFLITSDTTYLYPYFKSQDLLWYYFNSVSALTIKNQIQHQRLDTLKYYIEQRLYALDELYEGQQLNKPEIQKFQVMQTGKNFMFQAMLLIDQMKQTENNYYHERFTSAKAHSRNALILVTLFLSVSVIVAITSFYALTKSQREISEREIRYRNLFDQNKEIIFTLNRQLEVSDINRSVFDHLGYTQQEIQESGLFSKFNKHSKNEILDLIQTVNRVDNYEVEIVTRFNDNKVFLLNLILTDKLKGNYQGSLYDIHDRIKLEEERVSLERYANVGKVSRLIAHEVRNPLTNIQLSVEAISKVVSDQELSEYLRIIEKNAFRINNLVTELLSATKLNEFNLIPVPINQLIEEALVSAKDRIKLNNIRLIKNYDPEICKVMADAEKLKIALLNLLVNGIEAMETGGDLKIETKKVNGNCLVIIEDSGKGIYKEDLKKIFQPFFSTKSNGTGLGLATTQNIILNHAGSIQVESIPSKGTKFTVILKLE